HRRQTRQRRKRGAERLGQSIVLLARQLKRRHTAVARESIPHSCRASRRRVLTPDGAHRSIGLAWISRAPDMSRLSPKTLDALAKALSTAYVNQTELDALLRPLDQRFDDLTSQKESLLTNARQIVFAAQDKGWSGELLRALLNDRPNNAAVRGLAQLQPAIIEAPVISRQRNPGDRPSLACGRAEQWNSMSQCANAKSHQVIVVPGCLGQATIHFRDR